MKDLNVIDLTPVGAKYAITTDWFSAILSADAGLIDFESPLPLYSFDFGHIVFKKMELCAPMFKHGYEIILDGKDFGRVHVSPRSKAIFKENEMQFELCNNIHYEIAWTESLDYLLKKMSWKVANVSRLDIALDGIGFFDVMKKLFRGEIEKTGKSKIQFFTNSKINLEGCDIGKRSSNKWVTCYDKSAELEKSNKYYIKKFWERTGLDTERVERMELKLRNEAIKMIHNFDWKKLSDFEYLASIFRTYVEGGYVVNQETGNMKLTRGIVDFVEKGTDSNVSRKKRIQFINWDYLGGEKLERLSTKQSNEIYRMKLSCKTLVWIYVATKKNTGKEYPHYLHLAREIAESINCLQWMVDKYEGWLAEFDKRKFDYLPTYQTGYAGQQLNLYEMPTVSV